jgi:hypothetical protein
MKLISRSRAALSILLFKGKEARYWTLEEVYFNDL